MVNRPTVFLVDDDVAMLDAMREMVISLQYQPHCFRSSAEFLEQAVLSSGDCLVSDFRMPGLSGVELFQAVRLRHASLPLILVTGFGDMALAVKAMQLGAQTCLEKPIDPGDFISAVVGAVSHSQQARHADSGLMEIQVQLARLSMSERQVLEGMARGKTNRQIAEELDLSIRTVQFRRTSAKTKLAIRSNQQLACLLHLVAQLQECDAVTKQS